MSFAEWSRRWLATETHLKAKTRASYDSILKCHLLPRFGEIAIGSVDHPAMRSLVADLEAAGKGPGTIHNVVAVARNVFATAIASGAVRINPCDGLRLARSVSEDMCFLTAEQVADLVDELPDRWQLPVLLDAYMGLRAGELWALRVGRVNLVRRRLEVAETVSEVKGHQVWGAPKTYARRSVPLPAFLTDALTEHLARTGRADQPNALVFTLSGGGPVWHSNFYRRRFQPAVRRALPDEFHPRDKDNSDRQGLRFHDLRHTCAALMIAEGAHPKAIQERLGHSSITVTLDRYGHMFPSIDEALSDALDGVYQRSMEWRRNRPTTVLPLEAGAEG